MNESSQSVIASQRTPSLEAPSRRLLLKGMAGLGATLASSSLSPASAAQTQPGSPAKQVLPAQDLWGPFTPSSGAGRSLQLVYPPSTTKGELQLGPVYTLWIPHDLQTVVAGIVHRSAASIPAPQAVANLCE